MNQMVSRLSQPRFPGAAVLIMAPWLGLSLSACASKPATPFTSDLSAAKIVKQNADDAFVTHLAAQDVAALTEFKERIRDARSRTDLLAAWRTVPTLAAKGDDFLERQVFARAMADGDWPPGLQTTEIDAACVAGVQQAVAEFITRGGP